MTVLEIIEKARNSGVNVKEKAGDPGTFTLKKHGMVSLEVLDVCGHAVLIIDPLGRYPAHVSAENWVDIIFP